MIKLAEINDLEEIKMLCSACTLPMQNIGIFLSNGNYPKAGEYFFSEIVNSRFTAIKKHWFEGKGQLQGNQ